MFSMISSRVGLWPLREEIRFCLLLTGYRRSLTWWWPPKIGTLGNMEVLRRITRGRSREILFSWAMLTRCYGLSIVFKEAEEPNSMKIWTRADGQKWSEKA